MVGLDEKDRKLLAELAKDGRKSVVELSKDLDIPRATAQERLTKMISSGLIKKFVAVPDYTQIGKGVTAYVLASFSGGKNVSQRTLAEQMAKIPEVHEISLISGEWDILIKVRTSSVENVGKLVIDRLRMMEGVERTQTCVSFQTLKEDV
jgi:DNA-binding Lrp family transcriptional regulator